jgi:hypothetical protein
MAIWELGSIKDFAHNHRRKKGFSGPNDAAMLKKKEAMMRHSMKEGIAAASFTITKPAQGKQAKVVCVCFSIRWICELTQSGKGRRSSAHHVVGCICTNILLSETDGM